ncbi:hypothetical protein [Bradyrhizobium elkanii]|uniref:Uncharacterized protein n=1 Tax=Bradyrhizobium elkanii TaxID=29448 RepID=A0ABV4F030_BRAEL|nr:hypothetical protein [Bradyrhizobium elkanii]MCP1757796.1 hypothetical protein [Bradyrhizobium elkanii]MCS3881907.1 hypothetical protein [Bradyrhizobium elkanii]MCS4218667.1 hypothetical protein [Bradyrhizobium elkanii]MCW2110035.1 hypothetical protein [Bradyrhizobium elkanii]MCW2201594.1 hypothetical protein [Bradyrhizobium elkanii]
MPTPPQWKYVSRDLVITYQDIHTLAIKRGTAAERQRTGWGASYAVHPRNVELLSNTKALFDHDATYRFIWISDDELTDQRPVKHA